MQDFWKFIHIVVGKEDCKVELHREENKGEKHLRGSPASFHLHINARRK